MKSLDTNHGTDRTHCVKNVDFRDNMVLYPTSGENNSHEKHEKLMRKLNWRRSWAEFTETTTLHGLRFIFLHHTFTVRR